MTARGKGNLPKVHPLQDNQRKAVQPGDTVWLSASAGTGKTQVLSARVLRLLLSEGIDPSQILCLTFTKAGAAEMAGRISETLARWVRADDIRLAQELEAIGADIDERSRARARTLFASVLDCPGGGLRIDTIHAFSQWLLGAFPQEADLVPGTRAMEDRDRVLLLRQVLADLLVDAEGDPHDGALLLEALADLSLRMGPDAVEAFLLRCAAARDAWLGPGGWQAADMRANVLRLLGLPSDADESRLAALCADDAFDVAALRQCGAILAAWASKTGKIGSAAIDAWLAQGTAGRAATLDTLYLALFNKGNGAPTQLANALKFDPAYGDVIARVGEGLGLIRDMRSLLTLAGRLVPALRLGRAFAIAWDEAKQREGLIDFDDQIRRAAELLGNSAYAQWIGYKLDRRFDHILVDEAQDTNAAQWRIIDALTQEFFSGLGQRGDVLRTLFVVGDYKQAIFRFQGTSPENFEQARQRVKQQMQGAADNAALLRSNVRPGALQELGLERSYRTSQPVLDFVNAAIDGIGAARFGLEKSPDPHIGDARPGHVALWQPVGGKAEDADDDDDPDGGGDAADGSGPDWLSRPDRQMAERIARQVREWIDPQGEGYRLHKQGERRATAGDIMILVRARRALAGLIVARLHAAGVPVAGVDRLRLGAPLAVRDLVAALRFAAQPLDSLNLAALLVSPLIGWSQEQLLAHGYRGKHDPLWSHLRRSSHAEVVAVRERLGALLARADFDPPQALLHWMLVGPWQGRRALVARLGGEANDPIDELLNAAHAYAAAFTPSLTGFLHWFDAGEGELKREAGASRNLVRVMTVHGAKGLQAPIVILADAASDPRFGRQVKLDMPDPANPERIIPLPTVPKEERIGPLAARHAKTVEAEEQEHWRLLYVAMTRAEEALFIGGALGKSEKAPAETSWYAQLRHLFGPDAAVADPIWGSRLEWGEAQVMPPQKAGPPQLPLPDPLPRWLNTPPPEESRPPRPLAPSALGEDVSADPPWPPGSGGIAARRGVLVHRLLERLPELPPDRRVDAGAAWLARNASELSGPDRAALLDSALGVLANPDWAELFGPGSLAEVPIAATVGGRVVAGTIDRLLVTPQRIAFIDYKTTRRPPEHIADVPDGILRQMAAYAAALEVTFPGRLVTGALLFTAAPRLIALPAEVIARHKLDFLTPV